MRVAVSVPAVPPRVRTLLCAAMALALLATDAGAQVIGESVSRFRAGPMDVTLRYSEDRVRAMESQIRPVLAGALERYTQLFGGPPRGSDGQPLTSLVVRVHSDALGGAGSEQGMLQLLVARQPLFGYYDWRLMLLHEAFHLWSGESFRYVGPAEQWFHEGAAEFYAMQTAARLGVVDDVTAVRNAATTIGFYASARDQQRLALIEAGQQRDAHYFLLNHGGATAVLLLDYTIRGRTANAKSMDDVMRWMYANFDASSRRYTSMDLARGVRTATEQDLSEFFARYVMGRLPLPVSATVNVGELARSLQARKAGVGDAGAPDSVLLRTLGIDERRR